MKLSTLPLLLAPFLAPGLTGCIVTAHANHDMYEEGFEVIALKYAEASNIAHTLHGLGNRGSDDGRWKPVAISVDPRTNSLVLRGQRARVDELIEVIESLDVEIR